MRNIITAAAALMLTAAPAAYAQTEAAPAAPETAQTQQQATITKVDVVDITELPEQMQNRINQVTANSTDTELQSLRASIDAHEMAAAALKAEGIGSDSVVAAAMNPDGTLMLITKKS